MVLNAAFALAAAGVTDDPHEGLLLAADAIDSGAARQKLEMLIEVTGKMA